MKRLALVFALALAVACGGSNKDGKEVKDQNVSGECPGKASTTAKGVCLPLTWTQVDRPDYVQGLNPNSAVVLTEDPVPDNVRELIATHTVRGLTTLRQSIDHHHPEWPAYKNTNQFMVVMVRKQADNQDGTPALLVSGVQTAGTVINVYMDGRQKGEPIIVLPQPTNWDTPGYWTYLENSVRHEGEHVVEYKNHYGTFMSYVGPNDVHPHWPLPNAPQALKGRATQACSITIGEDSQQPVTLAR